MRAAVNLLRGVKDDRLQRSGLSETRTFGILSAYSDEWLMRVLGRCVTAGWVGFAGDDRPLVVLTPIGRAVMMAEQPARILLPAADAGLARSTRSREAPQPAEDQQPLDED